MCQYMLIIPTLTDVLRRIGVSTGLVGAIAGASDFASMFMTPGASKLTKCPTPSKFTRWQHHIRSGALHSQAAAPTSACLAQQHGLLCVCLAYCTLTLQLVWRSAGRL